MPQPLDAPANPPWVPPTHVLNPNFRDGVCLTDIFPKGKYLPKLKTKKSLSLRRLNTANFFTDKT
jgi:hypothetical protein